MNTVEVTITEEARCEFGVSVKRIQYSDGRLNFAVAINGVSVGYEYSQREWAEQLVDRIRYAISQGTEMRALQREGGEKPG